jgi:hypothetical protein
MDGSKSSRLDQSNAKRSLWKWAYPWDDGRKALRGKTWTGWHENLAIKQRLEILKDVGKQWADIWSFEGWEDVATLVHLSWKWLSILANFDDISSSNLFKPWPDLRFITKYFCALHYFEARTGIPCPPATIRFSKVAAISEQHNFQNRAKHTHKWMQTGEHFIEIISVHVQIFIWERENNSSSVMVTCDVRWSSDRKRQEWWLHNTLEICHLVNRDLSTFILCCSISYSKDKKKVLRQDGYST